MSDQARRLADANRELLGHLSVPSDGQTDAEWAESNTEHAREIFEEWCHKNGYVLVLPTEPPPVVSLHLRDICRRYFQSTRMFYGDNAVSKRCIMAHNYSLGLVYGPIVDSQLVFARRKDGGNGQEDRRAG